MSSLKKLKIASLTSTGEGIGDDNGLKVFVDGALPSEEVEVEITLQKKNYAVGKLLNVLHPSKHRESPICPIFDRCGGCQIMHLNYEEQLQVKRQRVIDALERIGHIKTAVNPCIPSPKKLHYRNKIMLPCFEGNVGLYKKGSHEIIPLEKCYIQSEEGEEILALIRPHLNHPAIRHICIKTGENQALVTIVTNGKCPDIRARAGKILKTSPLIKGVLENINTRDDNVIFSEDFKLHAGQDHIFAILNKKRLRISAPSFFQVNTLQAENLISYALEDIKKEDRILDPFCGVGTFSLFAAEKGLSLIGIEIVPSAISDAKENARLNGTNNAEFLVGKAEEIVHTLGDFNIALVNPPRKGCERSLIDALSKIKKIVYISCDPATLARDLALFVERGYRVKSVQPFDMFPQTMHVETVAILSN